MVNQKISEIAQKLWDIDVNRFKANQDYELDLQKKAQQDKFNCDDKCSRPLFKFVSEEKLNSTSTCKRFISLLDNYVLETRKGEVLTQKELDEESAFLDACMETEVLQEAFRFLVNEGEVADDPVEFKNLLSDIWFQFYARSTKSPVEDSSAFEHVFVGEKKEGGILGCHNWIQYYLLERKNKTNYYGYFPDECEYQGEDVCVLAMQFYQEGEIKTLGGFMIGVSPEFEIALYSILFLCCGQRTRLRFADMEITFNCFKMEREDKKVLATLYTSKN